MDPVDTSSGATAPTVRPITVRRHRLPTRVWHWVNGLTVFVMLMSGLMIGVLKGSTWASAVQVAGLVVAFVPLGAALLRGAARPPRRVMVRSVALLVLFVAGSVVAGRLG